MRTGVPRDPFCIGVDDTIILPVVLIAFLARTLSQAAVFLVSFASAFVVALVFWVLTSPLLVAAAAGDGLAWLIKRLGVPLSRAKAEAWRDLVDRRWSQLRQRLNSQAVAMRMHGVVQRGVAKALQSCRGLSPRAALLVIVSATLWLPLSAAISIATHLALIAYATFLPAWAQLLHPVATIIAKSKLLVLPLYPAVWPQARKHAQVQAALCSVDRISALGIVQKIAHRYQQTKHAFVRVGDLCLGVRRFLARKPTFGASKF
jgi:hypothetical protein